MKTKDMILAEALKTQDASKLLSLVDDAIRLAEFNAARKAFAEARATKLTEQVTRQVSIIKSLEKTLWGKK